MSPNEQTRSDSDLPTQASIGADKSEVTEELDWTLDSPSYFKHEVGEGCDFAYDAASSFNLDQLPLKFAGYTLLKKIGEGGAGIVFLANPDPENSSAHGYKTVAVKILRSEALARGSAVKRFEKESRLHSEIDCRFVTKHLEFGADRGVYFIASEFVEGCSLDKIIKRFSALSVKETFRVILDVLKALTAMHTKGLIHRDVKPANIIANFQNASLTMEQSKQRSSLGGDADLGAFVIAKLTDFGLARHIEQSESLAMTQQRTMLGTPLYMAPEQHFESRAVDARADVYSVGVTLYQMLVGRPPFESDEQVELAEMHRVERPIPVTIARPKTSEAINSIVMKALEKDPNLRYQHAHEMLADVERILADQPIALKTQAETPDAFHPAVRRYDFQWMLDVSPQQLWPLVADTDRFNRAIGLPAANFNYDHSSGQLRIFANTKFNGMKVRWREHPFQWIFEREMSVLREFESGPFEWVTSTVELQPLAGQKTRLIHSFKVKPRGWFGKMLTPIQFGVLIKRSLDKVYPRLEGIANDQSCGYACDVSFGADPRLSKAQTHLLEERVEQLGQSIKNVSLARELGEFIRRVADPLVARIRPLALAPKFGCTQDQALQACYAGIEVGLLSFSWDIICPVCQIAADNFDSLKHIESHVHCKVCNLEFQPDFADSVEAIFSAHPEIRNVERKTYCIGGPYHAPHVLAQSCLPASQHVDVGVALRAGRYRITGPQLNVQGDLDVADDAVASRAEFAIGGDVAAGLPTLCSGDACVSLKNQTDMEVIVRLEQRANRDDALSVTIASQHSLFRKLFPNDVKLVEQLVGVSRAYLLGFRHVEADALLEQIGDIQVRENWAKLQQLIPTEQVGCRVVECTHESLIASFDKLEDLLSTLLNLLSDAQAKLNVPIDKCCFAIHLGEVMTSTAANQPTTFGKTVRESKKSLTELSANELAVPRDVFEMLRRSESITAEVAENEQGEFNQTQRTVSICRQLLQRFELLGEADADCPFVKLALRVP